MSWKVPRLNPTVMPHGRTHSDLLRLSLHGEGDTYHFTDQANRVDCEGAAHCYSRRKAMGNPYHIAGLMYVDVQQESDHINVQVFLTDAGEKALAALNKGMVWCTIQQQVDVPGTRLFWEGYLRGESYAEVDLNTLRDIDHPQLADLWPLAMYEIMQRTKVKGIWMRTG